MKKVLSIDGGGIKGIIPAMQLVELERSLNGKICDHFDLIVGTSTGAILAAGLSMGFSAKGMLELYLTEGPNIFKKKGFRRLYSWAYGPKYTDKQFNIALKKYFKDSKLSDLKTDFMAITYDMSNSKPRYFSKSKDPNKKVWEVARASSSAPTFFNPMSINNNMHIDGGVVANNPSMYAFTEARHLYKVDPKDIHLLSLGTGIYKETHKNMSKWFKVKWINPLIDIMITADAGAVHYQLNQIYKSIGCTENYTRINGYFPNEFDVKMDDASNSNMSIIVSTGHTISYKYYKELVKWSIKLNQ